MYFLKKGKIVDKHDKKITNSKILKRIRTIYIPPGYKNITYHLQHDLLATGVDSKGRTQYIYSNEHKEKRKNKKRLIVKNVNHVILKLMKYVHQQMKSKDSHIQECAIAVQMILDCGFRIGHENNAEKYKHYGITTIRKKHLKIKNGTLTIRFIGKKGVENMSCVTNKYVRKFLHKRAKSSKGERLFTIFPVDVNHFLEDFGITNKDLRTWRENALFIQEKYANPTKDKKEILEIVAQKLHNTKTVCKGSYLLTKVYEDPYDSLKHSKKLNTKEIVRILAKKYV